MAEAQAKYKLVSADGHLKRASGCLDVAGGRQGQGSRTQGGQLGRGDGWVFPAMTSPSIQLGCDGRAQIRRTWARGAAMGHQPGSFDPVARVKEMQEDGVDAELIFGSNIRGPSWPAMRMPISIMR